MKDELQKTRSKMQKRINTIEKNSTNLYRKILIYKQRLRENALFNQILKDNYPDIYKEVVKKRLSMKDGKI